MKKESNILIQPFNLFCTQTKKLIGDSLFTNVLRLVAVYRNLVDDTENKTLFQPGSIFTFHKLASLLKTSVKNISLTSALLP